ncbi:MAG: hypothetical protein Q7T05_07345 [Dehalococcoidia bacterium]|nr:hypothetical protein [Dehalococcoidia bacterium]
MRLIEFLKGRKRAFPVALALILASLLAPSQAGAQGGIGMSGSFYQQAFQIPQGSSIGGPSIDVVVFNTGSDSMRVKMIAQVPPGVNMTLSHSDFTLAPGGQQQVLVGIEVTMNATPGEYDLGISAESYADAGTGIRMAGSAMQTAKLVVLGESAMVSVQAKSPDGRPIVAMIRLYRVVDGKNYEVAYSETGSIDLKVAPGKFIAISSIGGQQVAEETFSVAANDSKAVSLSGATVYFEGFGAVPNYQKEGGKLAFVQLVYTVNNLYQNVDKAEVVLSVSRDGSPAEATSLITLSPLALGRAGLNYNYIPTSGWKDGTYSFKLQLKLDGKPYASSPEQQVKVTGTEKSGGSGVSLAAIAGIAAALAIAVLGILLLRKRRHA